MTMESTFEQELEIMLDLEARPQRKWIEYVHRIRRWPCLRCYQARRPCVELAKLLGTEGASRSELSELQAGEHGDNRVQRGIERRLATGWTGRHDELLGNWRWGFDVGVKRNRVARGRRERDEWWRLGISHSRGGDGSPAPSVGVGGR
jgi:hypothetical protein